MEASTAGIPMASQPVPTSQPEGLDPDEFEILLQRAVALARSGEKRICAKLGDAIMGYAQIGETAGAIWQTLSTAGPVAMAALMEEVDAPQSVFFMAIGWLAREDKLEIEAANGDYTIRLK